MVKFPLIIRFHNWISLGWIVTRPAWRAHVFTSSNMLTRKDSEASWRARMAVLWKRRVGSRFWATSLTKRWKGSFLIKRFVDFWYLRISRRATVPGRKRRGFLNLPDVGRQIFIPFFVLYLPRGAFPPVLRRAVCFVRPMIVSRGSLIFFLVSSSEEIEKWISDGKSMVWQHIKTVYPG